MQVLRSVIGPKIDRITTIVVGSSSWLHNGGPIGPAGTAENEQGGNDTTTDLPVPESDARMTAREALVPPPVGQWQLNEGVVHPENSCYEFVFLLTGTDWSGRAQVCVDGSANQIHGIEREVYSQEESDE
ncbi:MAG: hypothetical protein ACI8XM_000402 [Haloarculaceae archaeon]|jgi:hypothetical protein